MRSPLVPVFLLAAALGVPAPAVSQDDAVAQAEQRPTPVPPKTLETPRAAPAAQPTPVPPSPASLRSLSNVQIELTISDQTGKGPVEKKTVSMIAASGTWGKVRSQGMTRPNERDGWQSVTLNVDARPFLRDGAVQLEMNISYNPLNAQTADAAQQSRRPTELNQSLTVVLQDGKPLIVSQAADPILDRRIVVEVKATIMK
jgi:hypothetical protein